MTNTTSQKSRKRLNLSHKFIIGLSSPSQQDTKKEQKSENRNDNPNRHVKQPVNAKRNSH